jgi:hypothetical protein
MNEFIAFLLGYMAILLTFVFVMWLFWGRHEGKVKVLINKSKLNAVSSNMKTAKESKKSIDLLYDKFFEDNKEVIEFHLSQITKYIDLGISKGDGRIDYTQIKLVESNINADLLVKIICKVLADKGYKVEKKHNHNSSRHCLHIIWE